MASTRFSCCSVTIITAEPSLRKQHIDLSPEQMQKILQKIVQKPSRHI